MTSRDLETLSQPRENKPMTIVEFIGSMRPQIALALPKGMDAERMARLALTVVRGNPKLMQCTQESFGAALMTATALGLEPGVNQEAYLVPYGKECTLIIGYQGFAKLFWNHPSAQHLDAHDVREGDFFDYQYGLEPYLNHKPARTDRGEITHYYAVASTTNGGRAFVVLTAAEVRQLRRGKVGSSGDIPDPQHWMERKTVIRQLVKLLPKSVQLQQALQVDEQPGSVLAAHQVPQRIHGDEGLPALPQPEALQIETSEAVNESTGEVYRSYDPNAPLEEPKGW